jgi:hypothetical protein
MSGVGSVENSWSSSPYRLPRPVRVCVKTSALNRAREPLRSFGAER